MKNSVRQVALVALVCALFAVLPASAELTVEQVQKLLADDGAARDLFSWSVSLDGDTMAIGAPGDDDSGERTGAVYVFIRTEGTWTQQAKLLADDGAAEDRFGACIAVDGDTIAVCAPGDDYPGYDPSCEIGYGSVYFFTRSNGVWTQQSKLHAEDEGSSSLAWPGFGRGISLDGDTLAVGSGYSCVVGVLEFTRSEGTWELQGLQTGSDEDQAFAQSFALSGDTIIIGATAEITGTYIGAAYVFTRRDGVWTQLAKLLAADGTAGDRFGSSVSLDGATAVIGAHGDDDNGENSGSAYVFTRTDGVWTQQAKLVAADGTAGDRFGLRVSLDADVVLISADWGEPNGENSGSAYVFTRTDGAWTQHAKLLADDGTAGDSFGYQLSLDGDTMVIGAYGDDDNGDRSGSAYVFRILSDPVDLLTALADQVRSLGLHHGTENSLIAKLDAALALLTDLVEDNDHAAANVLGAFINQVEAQHGKKIPAEDADGLIEDAQEIIGLLAEE